MEMLFLMKTINRIYLLLASALSVAVVMGIDSASPSVEGGASLDDASVSSVSNPASPEPSDDLNKLGLTPSQSGIR